MSDLDEITALQQENFRLRAMLQRHGIAIPPPFDLPNDAELETLAKLVGNAYPVLRCEGKDELDQFHNAIAYLCWAYRTDTLATEYSAAVWFGDAFKEWAANRGYSDVKMSLKPFTAAAVVSGVKFSPIDSHYPYISFGLALGSIGVASTAWRDTLRTRSLPKPTETMISHKVREHNWA
jgi:hypothetical protein